jgi:hypothetical protein
MNKYTKKYKSKMPHFVVKKLNIIVFVKNGYCFCTICTIENGKASLNGGQKGETVFIHCINLCIFTGGRRRLILFISRWSRRIRLRQIGIIYDLI